MKQSTIFSRLLCCLITYLFSSTLIAQIDSGVSNRTIPPSQVSHLYNNFPDAQLSDDFNGSNVDFSRWQYREPQKSDWSSSSSQVYVSSGHLTLKGSNGVGAGISNKNLSKYGFYITRWRVSGINDNQRSTWHPAVWAAGCHFSNPNNCISAVSNKTERLEIDFIEAFQSTNQPSWRSHILAWNNSSYHKSDLLNNQFTFPRGNNWKTMGVEYTEEYIRLWEKNGSNWSHIKTVFFANSGNTSTTLNNAHRQSLYWILSNKFKLPDNGGSSQDSFFEIDYFYYYKRNSNSQSSNIPQSAVYRLKATSNNKYLRGYDSNSSNTNGNNSKVTLYDYRSSWSTLKWKLIKDGNYYKLENINSNKMLRGYDPTSSNTQNNGANVTQYNNANWSTQKWTLVAAPESNTFHLKRAISSKYLRGYDPNASNKQGNNAYATINNPLSDMGTMSWKFEYVSANKSNGGKTRMDNAELEEEKIEINNVFVYPSPVKNSQFKIAMPSSINVGNRISITIFNIQGKKLYSKTINYDGKAIEIQKDLIKGVYLLNINNTNDNSSKTLKLIYN